MSLRKTSLVYFLLLSLALHVVILLSWPAPSRKAQPVDPIPVALLALPREIQKETQAEMKSARARPARPTDQGLAEPRSVPTPPPAHPAQEARTLAQKEIKKEEPVYEPPGEAEKTEMARRPLPTLQELLPPVMWSEHGSTSSGEDRPIALNTQEPRYRSYFASVKRAIELVWEYPEPALRHGLEGKLVLEFTILSNGALEGPRLLRSSGFSVLDQEAIRAVQVASPFQPIPLSVGRNRLDIIASFEYHDNRVRYDFMRRP